MADTFDLPVDTTAMLETLARRWWSKSAERAPLSGQHPTGVPTNMRISDKPGSLREGLDWLEGATDRANNPRNPFSYGHMPDGGVQLSWHGRQLADAIGAFTGVATEAPDLVALDASVVRALCDLLEFPARTSGGLLLTGSAAGVLHAAAAAAHTVPRRSRHRSVVYLSGQAHETVRRAADTVGLRVQQVPTTDKLRMDVDAARQMIRRDRRLGRRPLLLVATAGTTNTGTVDPLADIAAVAREMSLWLHVDAAYGGPYQWTYRGRRLLTGIERADSITFDGHKAMGLVHGSSALLVRDVARLRAAFGAHRAPYLPDVTDDPLVPDYAAHGLECTREFRGLQWWLPLWGLGTDAFRDTLDLQLDLAQLVSQKLAADTAFELPWPPDLATVAFRLPDVADYHQLIKRLADRGVEISLTTIHGRPVARMCLASWRIREEHVQIALEALTASARHPTRGALTTSHTDPTKLSNPARGGGGSASEVHPPREQGHNPTEPGLTTVRRPAVGRATKSPGE